MPKGLDIRNQEESQECDSKDVILVFSENVAHEGLSDAASGFQGFTTSFVIAMALMEVAAIETLCVLVHSDVRQDRSYRTIPEKEPRLTAATVTATCTASTTMDSRAATMDHPYDVHATQNRSDDSLAKFGATPQRRGDGPHDCDASSGNRRGHPGDCPMGPGG